MSLKVKLGVGLGVAALVVGFSVYLAAMLQQYGSECDSAYRHCAIAPEQIAFLEGEWCAAVDPAALRERFVFTPEGARTIQEGPILQTEPEWREARFFESLGQIVYFEHDLETGARISGEMTIRATGPDNRSTVVGGRQIAWIRCGAG
jgi:hypothetical protein